ncbi:glycosyltransferase family 2 protein [Microbacterium sp. PMB16]|uniref:glycosyltransferase family 2 protein n=1 Tax=Microbacterium sp. PMB16 TaxID=3120157 RepID=UPI003F4BBF7D
MIVPVFNPGETFDDLVASLDRQTMPAADFEVLLCDDGSGEPTRERLDAVARERSNVRVLHLPHSGWPGTPRNEGVAAAAGEYIFFVDQDDYLFDAALEKICDYADLHSSDVIVGKEVGIGRSLPRQIFRRDIPQAVLGKDPLLEMLTPHKMFRTSFLREHDIRFPDGRVRLEDHLFVMRAYFLADTISIFASEPCYAWVKHPGSASASRIDPVTYFPHLEAVLDLVEAHTEPGRLRDKLLRHWFRGKILKRLSGRQMVKYPAAHRDRLLDVVQPLVEARFGTGVDDGLAFPNRIRAALLRADRRPELLRLAEFEVGPECHAVVTAAKWTRGGGLDLTVDVRITTGGRDAFAVEDPAPGSGRVAWVPTAALGDLPPALLQSSRGVRRETIEVLIGDEITAQERRLLTRKPKKAGPIHLAIDPLRVFGREDRARRAGLSAKIRRGGWSFETPLTADPAVLAGLSASPLLAGRTCRLIETDTGALELVREWPGGAAKDFAGRAVRRLRALRKEMTADRRR